MHIGNGTVTVTCAAWGMAAAAAGWSAAAVMLRRSNTPQPQRFAAATALVFALQALNLPVLAHVSGHMVGGFLLAYWFGAAWGVAGMSLVLAAQGLLFGDGGWLGYGLNVLNMAVLPCLVVYPLWKLLAGGTQGWRRWASVAAAAWTATVLGAIACGLEIAATAGAGALSLLATLVSIHLLIGVLEATWTLLAIAAARAGDWHRRPWAAPVAVAGVVVLAALAASPWPDGLKHSLYLHGLHGVMDDVGGRIEQLQAAVAPFTDYTLVSTFIATAGVAVMALLLAGLPQWKARV